MPSTTRSHAKRVDKMRLTAPSKTGKGKKGKGKSDSKKLEEAASLAKSAVTSPNTLYFWRATPADTGFLSQWYYSPFTDQQGTVYKTAEQ